MGGGGGHSTPSLVVGVGTKHLGGARVKLAIGKSDLVVFMAVMWYHSNFQTGVLGIEV